MVVCRFVDWTVMARFLAALTVAVSAAALAMVRAPLSTTRTTVRLMISIPPSLSWSTFPAAFHQNKPETAQPASLLLACAAHCTL